MYIYNIYNTFILSILIIIFLANNSYVISTDCQEQKHPCTNENASNSSNRSSAPREVQSFPAHASLVSPVRSSRGPEAAVGRRRRSGCHWVPRFPLAARRLSTAGWGRRLLRPTSPGVCARTRLLRPCAAQADPRLRQLTQKQPAAKGVQGFHNQPPQSESAITHALVSLPSEKHRHSGRTGS